MHGRDRAAGGAGGGHLEQTGAGQTEAQFLALHVRPLHAEFGQQRIAGRFGPLHHPEGENQDRQHHPQKRPPLAGVSHHDAEGVGEGEGDE